MRVSQSAIGALLLLVSFLNSSTGDPERNQRTVRRTPYGTRSRPSERNPRFFAGSVYPTFDSNRQQKPSSSNWSHFFVMHSHDADKGTKPKGFFYQVGNDQQNNGFRPITPDFDLRSSSSPNGFFQPPVRQQPTRRFRNPPRRVPSSQSRPPPGAPARYGSQEFGPHFRPGHFGNRLPFAEPRPQHPGNGFAFGPVEEPIGPPPGPGDGPSNNGPEREEGRPFDNGAGEEPFNNSSTGNETVPSPPPPHSYDDSPFVPYHGGPYNRPPQPFVPRRPVPYGQARSPYYPPPPPYGFRDPHPPNNNASEVLSTESPLLPPVFIRPPFYPHPSQLGYPQDLYGQGPDGNSTTNVSSSSPDRTSPISSPGHFEPFPQHLPFPPYQSPPGNESLNNDTRSPHQFHHHGIQPQFFEGPYPQFPYPPLRPHIPPPSWNLTSQTPTRPPSAISQPVQFYPYEQPPPPYPYRRFPSQQHNGDFLNNPHSTNIFGARQREPPQQQYQQPQNFGNFLHRQQRIQPQSQYGVIDTHLQLPPLRFRFHIAPANGHPSSNDTFGQQGPHQNEPLRNAQFQQLQYEPQRLRPPPGRPVRQFIRRQNFLLLQVPILDQGANKQQSGNLGKKVGSDSITSTQSSVATTSNRLEKITEGRSASVTERAAKVKEETVSTEKETSTSSMTTTPLSTMTSVVTSTKTEFSNSSFFSEGGNTKNTRTFTAVSSTTMEKSASHEDSDSAKEFTSITLTAQTRETSVEISSNTTSESDGDDIVESAGGKTTDSSNETNSESIKEQSTESGLKETSKTTIEAKASVGTTVSESKDTSTVTGPSTQSEELEKSTSFLHSISEDSFMTMTGTLPFGTVTDPERSLTTHHKIAQQTNIS